MRAFILFCLPVVLLLHAGCAEVEIADQCSGLDEESCLDGCTFEDLPEKQCLQLCDELACPEGLVCVEDDRVARDGGLGIGYLFDVCRPE